jgi:hypothetical protein
MSMTVVAKTTGYYRSEVVMNDSPYGARHEVSWNCRGCGLTDRDVSTDRKGLVRSMTRRAQQHAKTCKH